MRREDLEESKRKENNQNVHKNDVEETSCILKLVRLRHKKKSSVDFLLTFLGGSDIESVFDTVGL